MIKNGRRGTLSGTLDRQRRPGPHRLSASRAQSDPSRRAGARRAGRGALGRRQRVLSADDVPVLEHPRRHRCDERDPRHARAAIQFPLRDREHPRVARRRGSKACSTRTGSTTISPGPVTASRSSRREGRLVDVADDVIRERKRASTPELSCTGGTSDGRFIARICAEIVEIGPVNESIHKLNERVAVADLEPLAGDLSRHPRAAARADADSATAAVDDRPPSSRRCATGCAMRCRASITPGSAFGHGSANAYDEAAYLLLHTLHLPLDRLEPFLDARLTHAERSEIAALLARRIDERVPAAYLTHEAWLGEFRFYVDERVIIPRSFIAELLPEDSRRTSATARR